MMKHNFRIFRMILKRTHTGKIALSFIICFFVCAALIQIAEPSITTYGESLWYSYVAVATIGFGDFAAVTAIGRILTVFISLHATLFLAIIPAIFVSYYMEVIHRREKESVSVMLDKLEHLPEMSKEELQAIADKIKKIK